MTHSAVKLWLNYPKTIRHDVYCCFTTFGAGLSTAEWSDCGSSESSLLCQILQGRLKQYLFFTTVRLSNKLQKVHKTRATCKAMIQLCTKQSVATKAFISIILSRYFVACLKFHAVCWLCLSRIVGCNTHGNKHQKHIIFSFSNYI